MRTTTMLGTVATEGRQVDGPEGAGSPLTLLRPQGRPLRNDGIRQHWMQAGYTYQIEHDGRGWRVDSPEWTGDWAGHTYRLVESNDLQWVSTLPTTDGGDLVLTVGERYELRETQPGGVWAVYTL